MWLFCPKCKHQHKLDLYESRYKVFTCGACNHKYRGIYAKINQTKHLFSQLFSRYEDAESTRCPYCTEAVIPYGRWPSVCPTCHKDLPLDKPDNGKEPTSVYTHTKQIGDPDGCGPCTSCGYVFQMYLDRATCPRCNVTMNKDEAFHACSNYPYAVPPQNQ